VKLRLVKLRLVKLRLARWRPVEPRLHRAHPKCIKLPRMATARTGTKTAIDRISNKVFGNSKGRASRASFFMMSL
jgi:hypothetical protein